MRSITFPILLLLSSAFVLGSACGSSGSGTSTSNAADSNTMAESDRGPSGNTNSQYLNADQNGNFAASTQMQRIQEMRANANRTGTPNIRSLNARPAAEDSTISSTLTDVAREVRTWKKDPVLAKVEKTFDGGDGSIKVYLRNGKVISLPGRSIAQLSEISAAAVLSLAGVKTSDPKAIQGRDLPVKKADN